ncbi:MAG: hypothetical protein ACETVQ_03910 [Candidatus Bathyarchaeia archaeon]
MTVMTFIDAIILSFSSTTFLVSLSIDLSCYIGGSLRLRFSWKSAFATQLAALLAELKVAFLIFHDGFCDLGAKVAGLPTACLPAQTGDEAAKAADILRVEDYPAGAD